MIVLRMLLWLLPRDFRREYGNELLMTARDHWLERAQSAGRVGRVRFWFRQWFAIARLAVSLRTKSNVTPGTTSRGGDRSAHRLIGLSGDVKHAARSLAGRPGFTIVAVVTLGLGVGATTTMFSAVHSVLLRALPYRDADEIVVVKRTDSRDGSLLNGVSAANMRDVAASARTLSHVAIAEAHGLRLVEDGRAFSLRAWLVSEDFFPAIGGQPLLGRTFLPDEFVSGRDKVVLLSQQTWQTRFAADPQIVGKALVLDGVVHTVVGVLPAEFRFPSGADVWGPKPVQPWDDGLRGRAQLDGVARLAPGATAAQAQAELDRVAAHLVEAHPLPNANMGLRVIPLRQHLFGDVESPLILLFGAVGMVLLIAAANVAGLQLARGAGRSREYAIRGALGANAGRILRLVAVESLLLATAGCLCGIGLAHLGVAIIQTLGPDHLPRIDELRIDRTVLGFAVVAAILSALLSGVAPALRASRSDLNVALSDATRGTTGGRRTTTLRDRLVVAQIALALVLTIGAGLLVRSFDRLLDVELGFDPDGKLAAQVWAYDDNHQSRLDFFERSVEKIRAVPGVDEVGLTTDLPLANDRSILSRSNAVRLTIDDRASQSDEDQPTADLVMIDSGYVGAMEIAMSAGRNFSTHDHAQSPPVMIVNAAFARSFFPTENPIGHRVTLDWRNNLSRAIVGVVPDVRRQGFDSEPRPEVYIPLSQEPGNGLTFVVKTATDPSSMISAVQEAMWAADPSQATWAMRPLTDLLWDWSRQRRFNTALLVTFASLALSLAAIGVYALTSFSVAHRVNELGIRRALGGSTQNILHMVLRRGLTLALIGVVLGLVGSVALTQLLRGMLFDVDPFDPVTFTTLSVFVVAIAVLAAFVPAYRATRIDPMVALRNE